MPHKKRKCTGCGSSFPKEEFWQIATGANFHTKECFFKHIRKPDNVKKLAEKGEKIKEKQNLKARREFKKNDKSFRMKKAQAAFNAYIRARDENEPCISCQRHHQGQYHAGHYRTTGACPELRFEELNCHKQCSACNNHLSGNIVEYRINLIKKIGLDKVEWLEGKHEPKRYAAEDLLQIERHYKQKLKDLLKSKQSN